VFRLGRKQRSLLANVAIPRGYFSPYFGEYSRHRKGRIRGREAVVAVTGGPLDFGAREQIFSGEFDGGGRKRGLLKNMGE
jgi:hypothetical protein